MQSLCARRALGEKSAVHRRRRLVVCWLLGRRGRGTRRALRRVGRRGASSVSIHPPGARRIGDAPASGARPARVQLDQPIKPPLAAGHVHPTRGGCGAVRRSAAGGPGRAEAPRGSTAPPGSALSRAKGDGHRAGGHGVRGHERFVHTITSTQVTQLSVELSSTVERGVQMRPRVTANCDDNGLFARGANCTQPPRLGPTTQSARMRLG